tara:strand:- start:288 stop:515 length:228 start_codon:yes stop_codon:yes gene_type:complete
MNLTVNRSLKMGITVENKSVYGNVLYYPSCDLAKQFCKLLGVKTLTFKNMSIIEDMGIKVSLKKTEDLNLKNGVK